MKLQELLEGYISGQLNFKDVDEWLSTYDWDAPLSSELASAGRLYLLATEAGEGLRPEGELRRAAEEELQALKSRVRVEWQAEPPKFALVATPVTPTERSWQMSSFPLEMSGQASTTAETRQEAFAFADK